MIKTYLALGDSYTIGEQVPLRESFPYQLLTLLRNEWAFSAPEIIAKTGWTTAELQQAIDQHNFLPSYDFVTLLIGVNNQYRGYDINIYKTEFEKLLNFAIEKSAGNAKQVIVVSIPDWGITPFAHDRDQPAIAREIDSYNQEAMRICLEKNITFIDITQAQRADNSLPGFIATDGLHPSGKEYAKWATKIMEHIRASGLTFQPGTD